LETREAKVRPRGALRSRIFSLFEEENGRAKGRTRREKLLVGRQDEHLRGPKPQESKGRRT
jgi:hypothetical protein